MAQVVKIREPGGPETLAFEDAPVPGPGPGEVLIRQTAVGVDFIDIYHRTGLYRLPSYPSGIGLEAVGVIERAGEGATAFTPGQRVAYCGGPPGGYTQWRAIAARHVVPLPDGVSDQTAAAVLLKGLTAQFLLRHTFPVQKGDTLLIHAAAGGVGLLACQWAKHLGATVIGTVGSEKKAALARKHGCDHVIVYTTENVPERVREITQGRGLDVVYDSVGKSTFMDSLDCLKRFGMMVSYGNASGPAPAIEPSLLAQKGSLYLTRPTLLHYIDDENAYRASAAELFAAVEKGVLTVTIAGAYPLAEARRAHEELESRKTTGALVLLP